MTFTNRARWMTGAGSPPKLTQRLLRMADGLMLGRPMATFVGGVSPTTHGGAHGVLGDDDLKVSVVSGLTVRVAPGAYSVLGTSAIDQGVYIGYNNANVDLVLDAYDTSPRTDLVIVRVYDDAEDSSGQTEVALESVKGTPGGGVPAPPANCLVLAEVTVPANSGNVTIANDRRPYVAAVGGVRRVRSTNRPTGGVRLGDRIFEVDTLREYVCVATTPSIVWRYAGGPPALAQVGATGLVVPDNTPYQVVFTAADFDPLGWWQSGSNPSRVAPTIAGWYRVTIRFNYANGSNWGRLEGALRKSGNAVWTFEENPHSGTVGAAEIAAGTLVQCNGSSDYLETWLLQDNTVGDARAADCTMLVELVYPV